MNDYIKLALSEVPLYFMNLMELSITPKSFLSGKCTTEVEATNKAAIFAGISLLITFIIEIPTLPQQANIANKFAVMMATEILLMLATVFVMRLAWKLVGGTATLRQLFVCTAYVLGPMLFIAVVGAVVGDVLFKILDPDGYALLRAKPLDVLPDASLAKGGFTAAKVSAAIGFGCAMVWLVAAWGAYREINGVSKVRSAFAFLLYNLIQIPLLGVAALFGMNLALA